jgi:hypothetical protein
VVGGRVSVGVGGPERRLARGVGDQSRSHRGRRGSNGGRVGGAGSGPGGGRWRMGQGRPSSPVR